ncbi:MAG: type II toxin-antitoxin system RelE/ParE family toxin [Bacteroidetes bacterium]|nr:type II toxin-antitoxin system RelE/ParE family toxin [Bacteroidota bacterium]
MAFEILITPQAEKDILESYSYYLINVSGTVAESFGLEINQAFDVLERNPYFQIRSNRFRGLPLKKFPFIIFFEIEESLMKVKILRVLNTNKNPVNWP